MAHWEDYLRRIYYDPSHPASYEGEKAVYNAVKEKKNIKYKIIIQGRKPSRLRTDAAKDFTSKVFQEYLKSKDIAHFTMHSEKQANYVE